MAVWAISDLHLPAKQKPMDIFGPHWTNHFERISEDWKEKITPDDIVLLPGDLTWAMHLEEAAEDLASIGALPGKKLLIRGNHDYWWSSIGRVRRMLTEGTWAIQNDALMLDGIVFAGTRGWTIPSPQDTESDDLKIYNRERQRLEMSLKRAKELSSEAPLVVMLHYPPMSEERKGFSDLLEEYGVQHLVYGHLHGTGLAGAITGIINGVHYHQVSCDGLDFRPTLIIE